jgi:hypothetical protein
MRIRMLVRLSLIRGKRLEPGEEIDVGEEIAVDLIQRRLAEPVPTHVEHAVGPGQER